MKKILKTLVLLSGTLFAAEGSDTYSVGVGMGQLYNGFGVNLAFPETTSMKYIALGLMGASYGSYEGFDGNYGLSIGYISTSILSDTNNNHGLGVHLGIAEYSYHTYSEGIGTSTGTGRDIGVQIGLGYTYFVNEISNEGWNFGLTPTLTFIDNRDSELGLLLNVGYQF